MAIESEHEALVYNYQEMVEAFDLKPFCYLVALDNWDISLILSALRYAHWSARWEGYEGYTFESIDERVRKVEECLMSGCDISQLITAIYEGFDKVSDGLANVVAQTTIVNPGCTSGGTELPSPDGQQGGTPPPGYEEPDPGTVNRKCKASNFIYDSLVSIITKLKIVDAEEWANIGFVLACGIVGAILGTQVPIAGTLVGAVAGTIASVMVLIITGGASLSLDDILTILDSEHIDLVCALYDSTSCSGARAAFLNIMGTAGATSTEQALCALCLPNRLLNLLFYTIAYYESTLDEWDCSINCTTECVEPGVVTIMLIDDVGELEWDGDTCIITAELYEGVNWRANFQCCLSTDFNDLRCAEISDLDTNISYDPIRENWIKRCDDSTGYLPKPFEEADIDHFKQLALCSANPFYISFTFEGEYIP